MDWFKQLMIIVTVSSGVLALAIYPGMLTLAMILFAALPAFVVLTGKRLKEPYDYLSDEIQTALTTALLFYVIGFLGLCFVFNTLPLFAGMITAVLGSLLD
jgi:hypothetical protein